MSPPPRSRLAAIVAHDLPASLVVFLVALPLSLGIAVASGAPARAGLVAAVVGGLVVGAIGGAPFQVSGPAAGLSVMLYGFVQRFGFGTTCLIGALGGALQLAAGSAGLARAALAISPAVLHAMLAGIGVLIALGQAHVLLGYTPHGSALANVRDLPAAIGGAHGDTLAVGALTLISLIAWNRFAARRVPAVPGALVAVAVGTLAAHWLPGVPRVHVVDGMLGDFTRPSLSALVAHPASELVLAALALTVVASAESLLCAVATDTLHRGPRADLNRELRAQGVANIVSGLLGGLPVTGVIVRSSANIGAGARSRASAMLHGAWVLLVVLFATPLLRAVPLAALGGLLVYVGVNLVKVHEYRQSARYGEALTYLATLGGVVFINLLWGIGIGLALALVRLLRNLSGVQVQIEEGERALEVTVRGHLSFLSAPALSSELALVPAGRHVRLRFEVSRVDQAAVEIIRAWKAGYERAGGTVEKDPLDALPGGALAEHPAR